MTDISPQAFVLTKEKIDAMLSSPSSQGKHMLEPLKTLAAEHGLPFKILEDCETINEAEVHRHEGDLWYCLEGEALFIYGGELADPRVKMRKNGTTDDQELLAKEISGGTEIILKPGDWLWIPPDTPHQHSCKNTARLMIIKIPIKGDKIN